MEIRKTAGGEWERWTSHGENGVELSHAGIKTQPSRYQNALLDAVLIGGVGTPPQYRRQGGVRAIFEEVFREAPERGWAVSLLHPFSFAYYRKFGFEKISEHRIVDFPMGALDFVPRFSGFVPAEGGRGISDLISVYSRFSGKRNLMFPRNDGKLFPDGSDGRSCWLYYDEKGVPQAYLILSVEDHLDVNRMVGDCLHVYEMAFTSPDALLKALGFLRMYEGQTDNVRLHDTGPMPEVELALRHYNHTKIRIVPDIAARILDTEAFLKSADYPAQEGRFTVHIDDSEPMVGGTFRVEFGGGDRKVLRISDSADADAVLPAPALAVLLYGAAALTAENAVYIPGVSVANPDTDLFRAFPVRPGGVFEHF